MYFENKISCSLTTVLYRLFRFLQYGNCKLCGVFFIAFPRKYILLELDLLRTSHLHTLSKLSENVFNVKVPFSSGWRLKKWSRNCALFIDTSNSILVFLWRVSTERYSFAALGSILARILQRVFTFLFLYFRINFYRVWGVVEGLHCWWEMVVPYKCFLSRFLTKLGGHNEELEKIVQ